MHRGKQYHDENQTNVMKIQLIGSKLVEGQGVGDETVIGKAVSPFADSPESIVASVPSNTALATSEASARVGRGFSCIESSWGVFPVVAETPASTDEMFNLATEKAKEAGFAGLKCV